MSSKSIVFYAISSSFQDVSFKLVEKILSLGEKVLFLCGSEEEVRFLDSKLWTFSKLSFIPHGSKFSATRETVPFCKVWFSTELDLTINPKNLIHNGIDVSSDASINFFQKIIDIFDKDKRSLAKSRSQNYRNVGFSDQKLWIQEENSWKSEIL